MDVEPTFTTDLRARLAGWVEAGLISADQADEIAAWEGSRQPAPGSTPAPAPVAPRRTVVVEALAYLGGAVILTALLVVTLAYWYLFGRGVRIAIPAVSTAILLVAGALVPQHLGAAAARMRGVLWLLSSATFAAATIVVVDLPDLSAGTAILVVAGALLAQTVPLWLAHRGSTQQLAAFVALELLALGVVVHMDGGGTAGGVALTAVALVWGLLAWRGLMPGGGRWLPSVAATGADPWSAGAAQRRWGLVLAAAGSVIGAVVLAAQQDRSWLGLLGVILVVAAAIALSDLALLGVGAVGTLVVLPMVVDHYVSSPLVTALVLLIAGAAMIGLAVMVARRRPRTPTDSRT